MNSNITMTKNFVLVKEPGGPFRKEVFPKSEEQLEWLQTKVNGYIETVPFKDVDKRILLICNEEGKFREDCKPNICLEGDMIMGTVVFVSYNSEGDMLPLTDDQYEYIKSTVPESMREKWFTTS